MSNPVLESFLKARGLIPNDYVTSREHPPPKNNKKIVEPVINTSLMTLNKIIESKPKKKVVIDYLKEKMINNEKEFLE